MKCGPIFQESSKNQLQNYSTMHVIYPLLTANNMHVQANYSACHMQLAF